MGNTLSTVADFVMPAPKCNFDAVCTRSDSEAIYQARYIFTEPQGYLKLTTDLFDGNIYHDKVAPENRKINYKIIRNADLVNEIRISAKLSKSIYQYVDESYPERINIHDKPAASKFDVCIQPGKLWLPWWDNAISDNYADATKTQKYRGGNRLMLDLRQVGTYEIMVPLDWDIDDGVNDTVVNENDDYIAKIFIHNDNGIFVKTQMNYPFAKPYGYVKIVSDTAPTQIHVVRTNSCNNFITMEGLFEKKYQNTADEMPWHDNTVTRNDKKIILPNPNRLFITITKPGNYTITLPDDCDLDIENREGDMSIKRGTGEMHLSATDMTEAGYSGYSANNYNSWSYHGVREQGYSNLKTKKGHIAIKYS